MPHCFVLGIFSLLLATSQDTQTPACCITTGNTNDKRPLHVLLGLEQLLIERIISAPLSHEQSPELL